MKPISCSFLMLCLFAGGSTVCAEEESPLAAADLFQSLDSNRDGALTLDEVDEGKRRFLERLVRIGDQDGDGKLSPKEFAAASQQTDKPVEVVGAPGGGPGRGEFSFGEVFQRMDADGDGKLSKDEVPGPARERLLPIFERLAKDSLTQAEIEREFRSSNGNTMAERLKQMDANGDGKLSKNEIPEQAPERLQNLLEQYGGEIDLKRMEQMAGRGDGRGTPGRPGGEGMPFPGDRPAPPILRVLDANRDGRISKEEAQTFATKFAELDRNRDGQIDPPELFGFGPPGRRPEDGPGPGGSRRPEGDAGRPENPSPSSNRPARPELE